MHLCGDAVSTLRSVTFTTLSHHIHTFSDTQMSFCERPFTSLLTNADTPCSLLHHAKWLKNKLRSLPLYQISWNLLGLNLLKSFWVGTRQGQRSIELIKNKVNILSVPCRPRALKWYRIQSKVAKKSSWINFRGHWGKFISLFSSSSCWIKGSWVMCFGNTVMALIDYWWTGLGSI